MRSLRLLKSSNLNQQHENTPPKISVTSKDAENEIFYKSEGISKRKIHLNVFSDLDQGQRDSVCKCDNVLQGEKDCNHLFISPGPTSLTLTPLPPSPSSSSKPSSPLSSSSPSSFSQLALSGEGCNERGGKCGRL